MSPLPGAYYSCCSPVYLFSDFSRIVWVSLFPSQCETCDIIPHSIKPWACVVSSKWQGFKQSSPDWLFLRSLHLAVGLCWHHIHFSGATILWIIAPCSINCPQSDTIKCGILCMDDFWGLAVKFALTPEGSLAGSFPDFLGKLAYYLVCCSHGAFKPSFNLFPTKYTLITRMPSDFIIPISAPNKLRSFSFVALCFNDLILFMEKKRKSLSYCSRARARAAARIFWSETSGL